MFYHEIVLHFFACFIHTLWISDIIDRTACEYLSINDYFFQT